ncbi:hypothetical protein [Haloarchaeobius litoreus]|uniref:Right handed beta helix region n=1 Tax=Haloarchaeobius litoreus TaxID=755306 RepID=A0ABD6DN75_9EURY|nr:hypothetical protein [Haloarchaeobius litoreus]
MGRRDSDRRRRPLLQTLGVGLSTPYWLRRLESRPPTTRPGDPTVRQASTVAAPAFVVHERSGRAHVERRGKDGTVFSGTADEALQYAVDAGSESGIGTAIGLAPGTYEVHRTVRLASSTWLAGSGTAANLRAGSGLDDDLLRVPPGTDHARISGVRLEGNRGENASGAAVSVAGYTWRTVLDGLVVRGPAGDGVRFEAGPEGEYSFEPVLADVDVARCGGDGFVFGHVGDLFGSNLYAEGCAGNGFTMAAAGSTVVHPHAYDNRGEAGVRVLESAIDLDLLGGHFERNRRHGALVKGERIAIRNAFFADNSRDAPDSYSGLVLDGARDCLVSESTFVNDEGGPRPQRHGIVETAASDTNRVTANLFRNHASGAVEKPAQPATSMYRDNVGYTTENGGTAAVGDGDGIPHGLDETPTQYWVQSGDPRTVARAVDVDGTDLTVSVVEVGSWSPMTDAVDVTWGATAIGGE